MPSPSPVGSRVRVVGALAAAAACVAAGIASIAACLTAPPPDVAASVNVRPEIVHDALQPPEGVLSLWPPDNVFVVPVLLPDPNATCRWRDFDLDVELGTLTELDDNVCVTSLLDGGVVVQNVPISEPTDGHCHIFKFIVAHGFSALTVPDSIEGDTATWEYEPPGALCTFYDAGAFQDGAFPAVDAASEALPITPESSTGDAGADP